MGQVWTKTCLFDPEGRKVATLNCLIPLFQNIIIAALTFVGIVALFFIIFSGLKFITSGGDPKALEGARKTFTFAIVGLLVVLFSFFIIRFIGTITGATCINSFGFTNCN